MTADTETRRWRKEEYYLQKPGHAALVWAQDPKHGEVAIGPMTHAVADVIVGREADNHELRAWIKGRHILPDGRCTECGVVGAHYPGCDVGMVLGEA